MDKTTIDEFIDKIIETMPKEIILCNMRNYKTYVINELKRRIDLNENK